MRRVDLGALLPKIVEIVCQAGEDVMAVYEEGSLEQQDKMDGSPLTRADLVAHRRLTRGVAGLGLGFPVVSEEDFISFPARCGESPFWLLDPLDGTWEFIARNGEFTVNVALIDAGRSVLGVVAAPALGQVYWAGRGLGAFCRVSGALRRMLVSQVQDQAVAPLRVVVSKSHLDEGTRAFIDSLGRTSLLQAGSSLKFCLVAQGLADLYPRLGPTCEWDTAAAQLVLEEAGGVVVDLQGQPLRYGKDNVLNPAFIGACSLDVIPRV
ncbi:3'(2'),5'-bisphosphate nucleotidase CysQ [Delftia acidovorans]